MADRRHGSASEMDLDEFLSHSGGSSGGAFLKNWREKGKIDVWLHPKGKTASLWSHLWFVSGGRKRRGSGRGGGGERSGIRMIRFNSYENEALLRRRNSRNNDGTLKYPPEICPFALTLEWVYQAIQSGKLKWTDVIFSIEDDEQPIELHAGGFCGLFQQRRDELSPEEKRELRAAGVNLKEAWRESCTAQLSYVFRVVQHADPDAGVLIAVEKQALGDAMKRAISDRIEDVGAKKGNPFLSPYAFRWSYDEQEAFSRKYSAKAMTSLELTPEVSDLFEQDPPDLSDLTAPGDLRLLRASFEQSWCHRKVTPPWDELFAAAEKEFGSSKSADDEDEDEDAGADEEEDETSFDYGANAKSKKTQEDEEEEPEDADDEEVACDVCDGPMKPDEATCRTCGTQYDLKTNKIVKRGEKPKRSRSGRRGAAGPDPDASDDPAEDN